MRHALFWVSESVDACWRFKVTSLLGTEHAMRRSIGDDALTALAVYSCTPTLSQCVSMPTFVSSVSHRTTRIPHCDSSITRRHLVRDMVNRVQADPCALVRNAMPTTLSLPTRLPLLLTQCCHSHSWRICCAAGEGNAQWKCLP